MAAEPAEHSSVLVSSRLRARLVHRSYRFTISASNEGMFLAELFLRFSISSLASAEVTTLGLHCNNPQLSVFTLMDGKDSQ